jgi:hypothetical protein
LIERRCIVCHSFRRVLSVECPKPDCAAYVEIEKSIDPACFICSHALTIREIVESVNPQCLEVAGGEPAISYCVNCQNDEQTVVPFGPEYLCVTCLSLHPFVGQCEHCGERIAGFAEMGSGLSGCGRCDGLDLTTRD